MGSWGQTFDIQGDARRLLGLPIKEVEQSSSSLGRSREAVSVGRMVPNSGFNQRQEAGLWLKSPEQVECFDYCKPEGRNAILASRRHR